MEGTFAAAAAAAGVAAALAQATVVVRARGLTGAASGAEMARWEHQVPAGGRGTICAARRRVRSAVSRLPQTLYIRYQCAGP